MNTILKMQKLYQNIKTIKRKNEVAGSIFNRLEKFIYNRNNSSTKFKK